MLYAKLQRKIGLDKNLSIKTVALHGQMLDLSGVELILSYFLSS